jgi:hypothetical protein
MGRAGLKKEAISQAHDKKNMKQTMLSVAFSK